MKLPEDFDPVIVDRALKRSERNSRTWRLRLKETTNGNDDPFSLTRPYLGATAYEQVLSLPSEDAFRRSYQRWTFRLMLERINYRAEQRHAFHRRHRVHSIEEPESGQLACSDLLHRALSSDRQRAAWLTGLASVSKETAASFSHLWQRRQEVARRIKLGSPSAIELPSEHAPTIADELLSSTDDAYASLGELPSGRWLEVALGCQASIGWPAKLTERRIATWFRDARFLEGLAIDTGPLPTCYGAASYLRVLDLLGAAFRRAIAPTKHAFVVCHDPYGLEEQTYGWVFARLLTNRAFVQRHLGIDRRNQQDHLRILHRALLFEARARAVRLRLRDPAHSGEAPLRAEFERNINEHLRWRVPADLAGVVLQPTPNAGQALAAVLLGERMYSALTEAHDEDWFRNPRAVDQLRSEGLTIPKCELAQDDWPRVGPGLAALLAEV